MVSDPIDLVLEVYPVHIQDAAKAKAAELDIRLHFSINHLIGEYSEHQNPQLAAISCGCVEKTGRRKSRKLTPVRFLDRQGIKYLVIYS
jgi:hypothetical protein